MDCLSSFSCVTLLFSDSLIFPLYYSIVDIIHLLPDSVANQIAAGEVIQRPASCLKELVENSLDAGATHIHILIVDAGRTLLQVIDNGSGMSEMDARMAFERHATSKIKEAADLFSLRTMGFRGEALASICAVAHIEVTTRRKEDEIGTLLEIAGSQVLRQEPCQCSVGTNIKVKDLFYNVPVRRKFLKTDATELRNLIQEFYHIALVYPSVRFTFVNQDEVMMDLPEQTYKQRIEAIFGKSTAKPYSAQLIDVHVDTELVNVHGFVGKPENAGRNAHQYFFVNGRYMRHPYFHKAVMAAYSGMLPGELIPSYFIYFDIDPQLIDVNIHPTKTEIKFQDEQYIFQILVAAIREALGKFNITPSLDFNRENEIEMPLLSSTCSSSSFSNSSRSTLPHIVTDPTYNPFKTHQRNDADLSSWKKLYEPLIEPREVMEEQSPILFSSSLPIPIQYNDRYMLVPCEQGILIINQHRAHFTVLYHRLLSQMKAQKGIKQQVLFPEEWHVSADEQVILTSIEKDLNYVGFDIEQFAKTGYSITAIPAAFGERSALPVLKDIIRQVQDIGTSVQEGWQQRIALILAADMAIPYGKHLSDQEMTDLVSALLEIPNYSIAPDGKRTLFLLSDDEIKKRL